MWSYFKLQYTSFNNRTFAELKTYFTNILMKAGHSSLFKTIK